MQKLALVYMIAMCKWLLFDSVVEYVWGAFIWGTLQQNGWVPSTYSRQTTSTSQFIPACKLKGGKKKGFGAHWAQAYSHLWELTVYTWIGFYGSEFLSVYVSLFHHTSDNTNIVHSQNRTEICILYMYVTSTHKLLRWAWASPLVRLHCARMCVFEATTYHKF